MNEILEFIFELFLSVPLVVSLSGFAVFFIYMTWPVIGVIRRSIWHTIFNAGVWSFSGVGVISTVLHSLNFAMQR